MKINMYQRFILAILRTYIERTARSPADHHFALILTTVINRGRVYEHDVAKFRYFNQWLEAEEARIAKEEGE